MCKLSKSWGWGGKTESERYKGNSLWVMDIARKIFDGDRMAVRRTQAVWVSPLQRPIPSSHSPSCSP